MARRSEDWNIGLAHDLPDPKFAREFLLGAVEEGVPVQVALAKVIRAMGVKEFAAKVRMASPMSCARSTHVTTRRRTRSIGSCGRSSSGSRLRRSSRRGDVVRPDSCRGCAETPTALWHNPGHNPVFGSICLP